MKNLTPSWTRITEKRGDNLKKAELNALAVRRTAPTKQVQGMQSGISEDTPTQRKEVVQ